METLFLVFLVLGATNLFFFGLFYGMTKSKNPAISKINIVAWRKLEAYSKDIRNLTYKDDFKKIKQKLDKLFPFYRSIVYMLIGIIGLIIISI